MSGEPLNRPNADGPARTVPQCARSFASLRKDDPAGCLVCRSMRVRNQRKSRGVGRPRSARTRSRGDAAHGHTRGQRANKAISALAGVSPSHGRASDTGARRAGPQFQTSEAVRRARGARARARAVACRAVRDKGRGGGSEVYSRAVFVSSHACERAKGGPYAERSRSSEGRWGMEGGIGHAGPRPLRGCIERVRGRKRRGGGGERRAKVEGRRKGRGRS